MGLHLSRGVIVSIAGDFLPSDEALFWKGSRRPGFSSWAGRPSPLWGAGLDPHGGCSQALLEAPLSFKGDRHYLLTPHVK